MFKDHVPGYQTLSGVLTRAYDQAARTKGAERHANSKPFHEQPMQTIADARGVGFLLGQADKKSIEAQGMMARGENARAVHELLGAINYIAGAIVFTEAKEAAKVNADARAEAEAKLRAKADADSKAKAEDEPTFKVGDRVRIIDDAALAKKLVRSANPSPGWISAMADHCGKFGEVTSDKNETQICVTADGESWAWPAECLEHVKDEITAEPTDPDDAGLAAVLQILMNRMLRGE